MSNPEPNPQVTPVAWPIEGYVYFTEQDGRISGMNPANIVGYVPSHQPGLTQIIIGSGQGPGLVRTVVGSFDPTTYVPGPVGPTGPQGPPGPTVVSADAGNSATLGSDHFIFVAVPAASTAMPKMDGAAIAGTGTVWSREDHVHPIDTSRYAASNPSNFVNASQAAAAAPVQSVASRAGAVVLTHVDITDWAASISQPGTAAPLQDGTAAPGTSMLYARQDHIHPREPTLVSTDANNFARLGSDGQIYVPARNPIFFCFPGIPRGLAVQIAPVTSVWTLAANGGGSQTAYNVAATADTVFTLTQKAANGAVTNLGTITFHAAGPATFSTAAATFNIGDAIIVTGPATADKTLDTPSIALQIMRQ